ALLEGARGDGTGDLARGHLQAAGEATALDHELMLGVAGRDPVEARLDVGALGDRGLLERVIAPEQVDRLGGGREGGAEAAEGAVVLAGLPDVQLGLDEGERERVAVAADRLRQRDDVRDDPGLLEAEEAAG